MSADLVTVTIDGQQVRVPKGTNLIEAARMVHCEIPHYCYHQNLSIAGNCRMCKVQIEGQPKLAIACNTTVAEGMVVRTQETSDEVANAQRSTLEFILVNHPLDCTVCDQAGHCKLQDYYYEYNGEASRFIGEKVHKVKAEPLGPEVIYDGERCILCTRCVRFCDEVTGTSELGVFNRGDHAVIGISPGKELDNPFSGVVVDLCPVGALTHRQWRFNSRIWYTDLKDSVCAGCSTGCNAKVAVRDNKVVQVKARDNQCVNKEWMCDEGRYGFHRFQPAARVTAPVLKQQANAEPQAALNAAAKLSEAGLGAAAIFLSPFLTVEEVFTALEFAQKVMGFDLTKEVDRSSIAMQVVRRKLSDLEQILISPDYAPNARAMNLFGLGIERDDWREVLESNYRSQLGKLAQGSFKRVLVVGEGAIREEDLTDAVRGGLANAAVSVGILASAASLATGCQVILPGRTVNEKSGVFVNRDLRFQRLTRLLDAPSGSHPEWVWLKKIAAAAKKLVVADAVNDDRALFREMTGKLKGVAGLTLARIGALGVSVDELTEASPGTASSTGSNA